MDDYKPRFCARCKVEIPRERAEGLPNTRLCINCVREVGGEFDATVEDEQLGKRESFKKNYGSMSIKRTRRKVDRLEE
jgi:hypothetical protein